MALSRTNKLVLGLTICGVVLAITIVVIALAEKRAACGHKTTEGDCQGEPVKFCDDIIQIYMDDEAAVDFDGRLAPILDVYQPHIDAKLEYAGSLPWTAHQPARSIWITRQNPDAGPNVDWEDTGETGSESTTWDANGCVITSLVGISRELEGKDATRILCHELGHSLGLIHSSVARSIMYADYGGQACKLTEKEQQVLQGLYP